jgi:hypothetical protein
VPSGLVAVFQVTRAARASGWSRRGNMMAGDGVVVYLGVYESADDAKADFADFKEAYKEGLIGLYDAGIVEKKPDGKIHVTKWEKPTQVGALAVLPWACSWESCSRPL